MSASLSKAAACLWAKSDPRHPLWCHLLDAAAVAHALIPRFWPDAPLPTSWLSFLVALHDVGKSDALFQLKAPEAIEPSFETSGLLAGIDKTKVRGFRHEARSADWIMCYLTSLGWSRSAINLVAAAIRGHHGNFGANAPIDERQGDWNTLRNELAEQIRAVIQPEGSFRPANLGNASEVGLRLSGLIVLSDWIASGTYPFGYHTIEKTDNPERYFESACKRAKEVVAKLALSVDEHTRFLEKPLEFHQVWPEISSLRPSQEALQQIVQDGIAPGLAILEAPMGEGKTEGAIYLAEEWNRQRSSTGAYIALPTMATSNQMHGRYAKYLSRRSPQGLQPRLIHGMSWLVGDDLPDAPETDDGSDQVEAARIRAWFGSLKRALLAPEGVGTVDQALTSALNVKYGFLRLFGLSRKVLIVDEVHAYDSYMQTILQRLLQWCQVLRIPIILLSATLSKSQKTALIQAYTGVEPEPGKAVESYPLLTFAPLEGKVFSRTTSKKYQQKTIRIELEHGLLHDSQETASRAAELVKQGGCVCVLVNTVRRAQEVFKALNKMISDGLLELDTKDLHLFHARFTAERRDDIEQKTTGRFGPNTDDKSQPNPKRPKRAILVCTQVVEQSLDVCFDVMLTDIAPIDLLLQRAGRLHRHEINPRYGHIIPTLHVALPTTQEPFNFGRIELKRSKNNVWRGVYDRAILLKTLAVLLSSKEFVLPLDFRTLIESAYGEHPLETSLKLAEQIKNAEVDWRQRIVEYRNAAKTHLIPHPDPEVFSYAQNTEAVDEAEDGARASYFRAQTRLGDDTRAALVLTEKNLINAFKNACKRDREAKRRREEGDKSARYQPKKGFLKKLFWQKASLPGYWLSAKPSAGNETFVENGPAWLRHHTVVIAPGGKWTGTRNGKPVTLRVDRTLGLLLETAEEEREGIEGA